MKHDLVSERFRQLLQIRFIVADADHVQHTGRFYLMHRGQELVNAFTPDELPDRQNMRYAVRFGGGKLVRDRDRGRDQLDFFGSDALPDQDIPHEFGQHDKLIAGADFPPERGEPAEVGAECVVR